MPPGNELDFIFGIACETHELALGSFRTHSRFVGEHNGHNLGHQVSGIRERLEQELVQFCLGHLALAKRRGNVVTHKLSCVEQLVDVVHVCTTGLFAVFDRHAVQHLLRFVAHEAKNHAEDDRNRRKNHHGLLESQATEIESHRNPLFFSVNICKNALNC